MAWNKLLVVLLLLVMIGALTVVILGSWPRSVTPNFTPATGLSAADAEQSLKEKLDNYSKRSDELQKITSLLLGLSTIYAIVLGISAYTSVQINLDQAKKSVDRADRSADKLETMTAAFQDLKNDQIKTLQDLKSVELKSLQELKESETKALQELKDSEAKALQDLKDIEIKKLQTEIDSFQARMTYATRIAIATMVSNFTLEEGIKRLQEESISALLELRNGNYSADPFVNLRLARLYRALHQYEPAEDVLSTYIARKRRSGEPADVATVTAYFNRACYRSLQWRTANEVERAVLAAPITQDLKRCFRLDPDTKKDALRDKDFDHLHNQSWFQELVPG